MGLILRIVIIAILGFIGAVAVYTQASQAPASYIGNFTVTEYEPPRTLTFEQSQQMKLLIFNITVSVHIRYTLEPNDGTHLKRDVKIDIQRVPNFMKFVVMHQIRAENERILANLKAYLEKTT